MTAPDRAAFTKNIAATPGVYGVGGAPDRGGPMRGPLVTAGTPASSTFDQAGYDAATAKYKTDLASATSNPDFGSLTRNFTGADLQNEPGYQFGQQQGQLAIDRAASAAGRYDSGDTLKALTRFGNDYAGTKYNEAFNRDSTNKSRAYGFLTGVSNTGENAAAQTGAFGANAANSSGNFLTGGADASAAGIIGASNSLSGGVGNYLQYNQNQATLNYLKGLRGSSVGNGWGSGGGGVNYSGNM